MGRPYSPPPSTKTTNSRLPVGRAAAASGAAGAGAETSDCTSAGVTGGASGTCNCTSAGVTATARTSRPAGSREFVVFVLGGGEYGLPTAGVREIVRYTPPRPLPGMRAGVLGLVQVHGRLLDVIDVRGTLGLPADAEPRELVVVEHGDRTVAMPVEAIRQVVSVGPADLREPPDANAEVEVVATLDDRLVLVLRPEAVVGPAG